MEKRIISSSKVDSLKPSLTSSLIGCAETLTEKNGTSNHPDSSKLQEFVRLAFRRNQVITSLVSAMRYYNIDGLVDEMPEDFNDQCLDYLDDLCLGNDLTLYHLLNDLEKK